MLSISDIALLIPSAFRWLTIAVILLMYIHAYRYYNNGGSFLFKELYKKAFQTGRVSGKTISWPIVHFLNSGILIINTIIMEPLLKILSTIINQTIGPFINTFMDTMDLSKLDEKVRKELEKIKKLFQQLDSLIRDNIKKVDDFFKSLSDVNKAADIVKKKILEITSLVANKLREFISSQSAKVKEFITKTLPKLITDSLKDINKGTSEKIGEIQSKIQSLFSVDPHIDSNIKNALNKNILRTVINEAEFRNKLNTKYQEVENHIMGRLTEEINKLFNPNKGLKEISQFLGKTSTQFKSLSGKTDQLFKQFDINDIGNNKAIQFISNIFNKPHRGGPCLEKCYFTEVFKDFRFGRRNWFAVRLQHKTSDSRCDFPYDWRIEYNTDGNKGKAFLQMHNGCRADFFILRASGEKYFYGNQNDWQSGNPHMYITNNPLYSLSVTKWNAIRDINGTTGWRDGGVTMTDFNPSQIDNLIQDMLLISLADFNFFQAYKDLPENLTSYFISNFTFKCIQSIVKVAKSVSDAGVREARSIRLENTPVTEERFLTIMNNMKNDGMFRDKATGIYYLRGILLNFEDRTIKSNPFPNDTVIFDRTCFLRSTWNKTIQNNANGIAFALNENKGSWEAVQFKRGNNGTSFIRSEKNGNNLQVDPNGGICKFANKNMGAWETFRIEARMGKIFLIAHTGNVVQVTPDGTVRALNHHRGSWEGLIVEF